MAPLGGILSKKPALRWRLSLWTTRLWFFTRSELHLELSELALSHFCCFFFPHHPFQWSLERASFALPERSKFFFLNYRCPLLSLRHHFILNYPSFILTKCLRIYPDILLTALAICSLLFFPVMSRDTRLTRTAFLELFPLESNG